MIELRCFSDGTRLVFESGNFDDYRVSFYRGDHYLNSPTDVDTLNALLRIGDCQSVMGVIDSVAKQIRKTTQFSQVEIHTVNDILSERKLFSSIVAMMIAEERKEGTKLGKLVKILGCYQVLIEDQTPEWAANWSKGRSAYEIRKRCKEVGIIPTKEKLQISLF